MQKFTLCSLNGCGSLVEICLWVNVSVDLDVNCSHEIDNFRLFCGGVIVSDVRGACIDPGVILRTKKVRLSGNICMNSWGLNITKFSRTISEDWLCSIFLPFFFLFTFIIEKRHLCERSHLILLGGLSLSPVVLSCVTAYRQTRPSKGFGSPVEIY